MKIKNKKSNLEAENFDVKVVALVFYFRVLIFSAGFCLFASVSCAETMSEQFDPVTFLGNVLIEPLRSTNTTNISKAAAEQNVISSPQIPDTASQNDRHYPQSYIFNRPPENVALNASVFINKPKQQNSALSTNEPDTHFALNLWREEITLPQTEDSNSQKDLQRLIEQVCSVEFEDENRASEGVIIIESDGMAEDKDAASDTEAGAKLIEKSGKEQVKSRQQEQSAAFPDEKRDVQLDKDVLPYKPVTPEILKMLEKMSTKLDSLDNPLELGDILFLSGHRKEAAMVYKKALELEDANEADSGRDRAWLLFQTANCLRNEDLEMASKVYKQLITDHPDSQWAELAKVQDKLIDWLRAEKPRKLTDENR